MHIVNKIKVQYNLFFNVNALPQSKSEIWTTLLKSLVTFISLYLFQIIYQNLKRFELIVDVILIVIWIPSHKTRRKRFCKFLRGLLHHKSFCSFNSSDWHKTQHSYNNDKRLAVKSKFKCSSSRRNPPKHKIFALIHDLQCRLSLFWFEILIFYSKSVLLALFERDMRVIWVDVRHSGN